jgi:AcrR family transcriptional regulator
MSAVRAARSLRGRSTARGEASREHLLDCAVELLREGGYGRVTLSALCERADISATSVYWHFGSKAGLLEALLERVSSRHTERIRSAVKDAPGGPADRLEQMLSQVRKLVLEQPLGSLTGVALLSEGKVVAADLRETLKESRRREVELLAADFDAELAGRPPGGEALALVSIACSNFAALTYLISQDEAEVDQILDALRRVLLLVAATLATDEAGP